MERFYYEKPSTDRKDEIIEYLNEFIEYGSNINGSGSLDKIFDGYTFEEALDRCLNMEDEEYAKSVNRCPGETFLLIREKDNRIVGSINIRWNLTEAMLNCGGHIGYSIRPSERQKGYNKINLYIGLKELQKLNEKEALLDADLDNEASWKTMEALGGKRIKEYIDEYDQSESVKYLIPVNESIEKYQNIYEPFICKNNQKHL